MKLVDLLPKDIVKVLHNENIQLADKVYFKTNKLSNEDRDLIIGITNKDNYTKIISDFYYYLKDNSLYKAGIPKQLKDLYSDVKNYNKNVYPIKEYDINNLKDVPSTLTALQTRRDIIFNIKRLPSIALRNMKDDIREERDYKELKDYLKDLDYFLSHYSLLANREKDVQIKILQKMFKGNTTLKQLMRFVDDKENFIGGVDFTKEDVKKLSESEDLEIIYEQGSIMIVRVDSPDGIKAIGCNSLWCFTYGSGFDDAYRQWNNYSHNDIVYVLIDFREKSDSQDFMYVLVKPLINDNGRFIKYDEDNEDEHPLFNMANENFSNPYSVLEYLFGNNYKKVVKKYLNFEY